MTPWCFRAHLDPHSLHVIGPTRHTVSDFLQCQILHSPTLVYLLVLLGVVRCPEECAVVTWSWRFWQPSGFRGRVWEIVVRAVREGW